MKRAAASRLTKVGAVALLAAASLWFAGNAVGRVAAESAGFMPHGYCYLWNPAMLWLHVASDALIALSYYCIPLGLIYLARRRQDLPFNMIFWMFGLFILGCGTTHLMEIWTVWHASYLAAGIVKAITAAVSVVTAVMLIPLLPKAIALPSIEQLHGINYELRLQVVEREEAEKKLQETLAARERTLAELADHKSAVEELQLAQEALLEQERVLSDAQRLGRFGSWTYEYTGRLTWSQELYRLYGVSPETFTPSIEAFLGLLVAEDRPGMRRWFEACWTGGKPGEFEFRIALPDGTVRHINGSGELQCDAENHPLRMTGTGQDITERKHAERVLLKSSALSKQAFKELKDQKFALDQHAIVATTDVHGTITYVNDKFCAISKYSRQELVGQNHRILKSGHHPKEFFQQMYRIIANGRVWRGEICNRAKDGSLYWVDATIVPFLEGDGKPRQYMAIRTDITERKQAEERLAAQGEELSHQAEELLRSQEALEQQQLILHSVLDSMAEGLVATDEQGKFIIWNPAAAKIVGMGAENVPSGEWNKHYGVFMSDTVTAYPPDQNPLLRAIHGEAGTAELYVRNSELDEGAWLEVTGGPLKDKTGRIRGGVVAFRDITQRKIDEQEIRKLNEDLELMVAERTAELQGANRELEAFTYSVSHDLRAPLRHIGGFSRILMEDFGPGMPPEARLHVERIEDGVRRMGLLVDELLNLARVGRHTLALQPTELNSILEDVVTLLQPEIGSRSVTWKIDKLPPAKCDPVLVKQVFQNLVSNALKFTRPRNPAVIEISHRRAGGETAIFVRDNGVGFSMKYKDKLFGVFQRLHRAEDFEGTGIGLATVQRIVHKHGGRVWAESELDKGATFYFTLAAAEGVAGKPGQIKSQAETSEDKNKTTAAGATL